MHGLPKTIEWSGTSQFTYEFGAIKTSLPTWIDPTIVAFTPIHTLSPITGVPLRFPRFSCPIVTPLCRFIFLPKTAFGLIVMQYAWPKYNPAPIWVSASISIHRLVRYRLYSFLHNFFIRGFWASCALRYQTWNFGTPPRDISVYPITKQYYSSHYAPI